MHDTIQGIKIHKFNIVSINSQRFLKTEDLFILASQASQVFNYNDVSNKGWIVATEVQLRDAYNISLPTDDEATSKLNKA